MQFIHIFKRKVILWRISITFILEKLHCINLDYTFTELVFGRVGSHPDDLRLILFYFVFIKFDSTLFILVQYKR